MVRVLVVAVTVEALVEYGKNIGKAFIAGNWKTAVTQLSAMALGIILCFAGCGDLFAAVGMPFHWGWLGTVLTGILVSRGANYVSDFVKKLQQRKEG